MGRWVMRGAAAAILMLLLASGFLAYRAIDLDLGGGGDDKAAVLQAYGSVIAALGTAALIGVTAVYVQFTGRILETSQPSLTVSLRHSFVSQELGMIAPRPFEGDLDVVWPDKRFKEHFITVHVLNSGGAATTIQGWGVEFTGGVVASYGPAPALGELVLPHRLEPHSTADFHLPGHYMVPYAETALKIWTKRRKWWQGKEIRVRATVSTASGSAESDWIRTPVPPSNRDDAAEEVLSDPEES